MSRIIHRRIIARRTVVIVTLGAGFFAASTAWGLPVFGGPTFSPTGGGHLDFERSSLRPSNGGATISTLFAFDAAGEGLGRQSLRWDVSGAAPVELGGVGLVFGRTSTSAIAINASGTAVGTGSKMPGGRVRGDSPIVSTKAIRWDSNTTVATELGDLVPGNFSSESVALDVNASGAAVGLSNIFGAGGGNGSNPEGERAVRWDAGTVTAVALQGLGTPAFGERRSVAYAINNAGTAVGEALKPGANNTLLGLRAVRWAAGGTVATELGGLGTVPVNPDFHGASAFDLNADGTAVGRVTKYDATGVRRGERAVRWDAGGTVATELGNLGTNANGVTDSVASGINDAGTAFGRADKYDAAGAYRGSRAVRWEAGRTAATELGNLGTDPSGNTFTGVGGMNALGILVGGATKYVNGVSAGNVAVLWGADFVAIDLNTLLPAGSGWTRLGSARGVSDTGWIAGSGTYDPDGVGTGQNAYDRAFMILVPQAGTYGRGDANFDTLVGFADLVTLAQNYGQANAGLNVNVGDLDLNGFVDFQDLVTLAQNYAGGPSLAGAADPGFAADWALAQALVPEPVAVVATLALPAVITRRRR